MDANRFDAVSKLFAKRRLSRRSAVAGAGLAAATALAVGLDQHANAQDATPVATLPSDADSQSPEDYLFVQSFQSGTLETLGNEPHRFTVNLENGLGQTIYFTDRPNRLVGAVPTDKFLDYLGFTPANPPNAALLVEREAGHTDIAVVELFNPVYDTDTRNLTYEVTVLDDWEKVVDLEFRHDPVEEPPATFGTAHIFIDGLSDCPGATMQCFAPGTSHSSGAPVGTIEIPNYCAADGNAGACFPCDSQDPAYWRDQCNQLFEACNGACTEWNFCSRDSFISSNTMCQASDVYGTWQGW
jgi:hypothetical protein